MPLKSAPRLSLGLLALLLSACPDPDADVTASDSTLEVTESPTATADPTNLDVTPTPTPTASTETPETDTPATDTPETDTPATDTPATDTPATDTPATDTPATETPGTPTPTFETPTVTNDDSPSVTPTAETPTAETPTAETPTEASPTPTPEAPTELPDEDGDGFNSAQDCDDLNPDVNPDAIEICNGLDDDCDTLTDDADDSPEGQSSFYADVDGDGYGDAASVTVACAAPDGSVDNADDCDDTNSALNPDTQWYGDSDGDGFGDTGSLLTQCEMPDGYVGVDGDCDDSSDAFYPGAEGEACDDPNDYNCDGATLYGDVDGDGDPTCLDCDDDNADISSDAPEVCDGIDNDCDELVDDADEDIQGQLTFYSDEDGDGYGDGAVLACAPIEGGFPSGTSPISGDCDDSDAAINPETVWHLDFDQDGFGGEGLTLVQCEMPDGYVLEIGDCNDADDDYYPGAPEDNCADPEDYNCDGSVAFNDSDGDGFAACDDCDDTDAAINNDAPEVCDGSDNNCDGLVDDEDPDLLNPGTWYDDQDGDGYGAPGTGSQACEAPIGTVAQAGDCDDTDAAINPDTTWYIDVDNDGFGSDDPRFNRVQCAAPAGYVAVAGDCNDAQAPINPDATETCDGADNDCDGDADESGAEGTSTFYGDDDGDGFGELEDALIACFLPDGFAEVSGDCEDDDEVIYPGAPELCDSKDNDCDGESDNGLLGQDALCSAVDCLDLKTQVPDAEDGVYWIQPVGVPNAYEAFCEMDIDGGGWTLVASVVDRSYFRQTVCTTACGDNPTTSCSETPFVTAGTAGSVESRINSDHKSLAYSTVPFREMLFQDNLDQWAAYEIAEEGEDDLASVLDFYPAGLRNWVSANVEAHSSYTYLPSATNLTPALNACNTLRMSFNVEDSDSAVGGGCHSTRKGPGWSSINNNTCYWDDGGQAWTHTAFYQGNGTAYRYWMVR